MVAVDSIGKCSHFIEMVTMVTAAGATNLYLQNIWKLHGLLQKVVSDCEPQFVAAFMKELYQLLEIEATTSTAYHLQTDGQTEWVNQELEQYLQILIGERQDDCYTLLPLVEFSYNNHVHLSTQQTPFLLDTSQHSQMGFELYQPLFHFEVVNEFTDQIKDTLEKSQCWPRQRTTWHSTTTAATPPHRPSLLVTWSTLTLKTSRPPTCLRSFCTAA